MTGDEPPRLHALLIGIDGYSSGPLTGCVNDVDLIERMLAPIPGVEIRRLVDQDATIDNIRAELKALRSDAIRACDRVVVFYSGHSTRVEFVSPEGLRYHREGWLPVDYDVDENTKRPLFDLELNFNLAGIADRTSRVTVVIDSCFSAGVTRGDVEGQVARFVELDPKQCVAPSASSASRGIARGVDACQVVAACMGHEAAREGGSEGERAGVFTRAVVTALAEVAAADLLTVPWSRFWQQICDEVTRRNASQHPWMSGSAARSVIAGPPVEADAGFAIAREGSGRYAIRAGTLAGVTKGAQLAVYGERPARFDPIGSDRDREARTGHLTITDAQRASATAVAIGEPFELPVAARARLIEAGESARLACRVVPPDRELEAALVATGLVTIVDGHARVELVRSGDAWNLFDDIHGSSAISHPLAVATRATAAGMVEHYARYSLPLRMAEQCTDAPGALELLVLLAPDKRVAPQLAQAAALSELPREASGVYAVVRGIKVCFRVHNHGAMRLRVTLVNCAGSGRVQLIGDQTIDPGTQYTFWDSTNGDGFAAVIRDGRSQIVDRLVAIGRTDVGHDLAYLEVLTGFSDVPKGETRGDGDEPVGTWTAVSQPMIIRSS